MKTYLKVAVTFIVSVFIIGNIITAVVRDSVKIDRESYILKNGFPIFTSKEDYIKLICSYPYNTGVILQIHKVKTGESLWDIADANNISIDTVIAANPFLKSLNPRAGEQIIIPSEDGVLMAFDDIRDVWRMSKLLNYRDKILGDFFPSFFKVISTDDMRFVFFKKASPAILNDRIKRIYAFKNYFQRPLKGSFTSMFGHRNHPYNPGYSFHNGVDILARHGTPFKPCREGIVTFAGWHGGYGNAIIIQHHEGYTSLYAHCSKLKAKKGDWVTKKDVIGYIGSSGKSTGAHLHFTVTKHGKPINPMIFIW
ncbi:peptidoglycan DD-metalloendopeptidase family protein [Spirochaetota bacterium]